MFRNSMQNNRIWSNLEVILAGITRHTFTLAIFAAILAAISNRPCKLLAIPRRFQSPVVYTDDLKSHLKSQLKSQQKSPV